MEHGKEDSMEKHKESNGNCDKVKDIVADTELEEGEIPGEEEEVASGRDSARLVNSAVEVVDSVKAPSKIDESRRITTVEAIRNKAIKRKRMIEKEREAARKELEKVEASVYVEDFNKTYKEFMMLISSENNESND
ncbi:hypothetical protein MA16_Dca016079 [Dendrobium catenatum]|uniref:Uncharacterized protein n=1 Tax=Dendrobium catenatum TaxID=906689 RepID=A0A2I0WIY1_9ASPA|nr:hypothetical protein MA16_Dca016079 [Dendrobium catenatum]